MCAFPIYNLHEMYAKKTIKNTIYNSSKLPKTKPKEKQQSHKNNSKVFDEMIFKGYKPLRQWLSDMESEFSVSRKKTSVIFALFYILSHPRITNFFSFSSCLSPSMHVLTENNATLWKKNLGKEWNGLWNIYSLAHQTLSKKVSSKDTQRFRTHRRERDHAFEKIRLHINWVAGSQKKWAPSLTFYSFLKFWRQQNFTGWGVDFDKKQKAQRPDQFQKPNLLKLVGKWTVSRF